MTPRASILVYDIAMSTVSGEDASSKNHKRVTIFALIPLFLLGFALAAAMGVAIAIALRHLAKSQMLTYLPAFLTEPRAMMLRLSAMFSLAFGWHTIMDEQPGRWCSFVLEWQILTDLGFSAVAGVLVVFFGAICLRQVGEKAVQLPKAPRNPNRDVESACWEKRPFAGDD